MQAGLKNHLVHSSNNSECNRCELAVVRNLFLTTALRLDRRWDLRLTPVQLL